MQGIIYLSRNKLKYPCYVSYRHLNNEAHDRYLTEFWIWLMSFKEGKIFVYSEHLVYIWYIMNPVMLGTHTYS